jgi:hypothetical protein
MSENANRAARRRADQEKRRKGKRGKFNRTDAAVVVEQIKANVASWEQNREFHELNVDKNEAMIDTLDEKAPDHAARLQEREQAIAAEERAIHEIDVAIELAEKRIAELS